MPISFAKPFLHSFGMSQLISFASLAIEELFWENCCETSAALEINDASYVIEVALP